MLLKIKLDMTSGRTSELCWRPCYFQVSLGPFLRADPVHQGLRTLTFVLYASRALAAAVHMHPGASSCRYSSLQVTTQFTTISQVHCTSIAIHGSCPTDVGPGHHSQLATTRNCLRRPAVMMRWLGPVVCRRQQTLHEYPFISHHTTGWSHSASFPRFLVDKAWLRHPVHHWSLAGCTQAGAQFVFFVFAGCSNVPNPTCTAHLTQTRAISRQKLML